MAPKIYAISDLHLDYAVNRAALEALPARPQDALILAGDVGPKEADLHAALEHLTPRFARIVWTPGNHDLWTLPHRPGELRGEAKYQRLVSLCRQYGVITPEDPFQSWTVDDRPWILAPVFLLYDYSFRPPDIPESLAVEWAKESGVLCADEYLLHSDPYPSRSSWCHARCIATEQKLAGLPPHAHVILISHYPLRCDLIDLPLIPRFSLWCGTRRTEEWHKRFPISVVVYGHLHRRSTSFRDGVRFEEVSLGYPRHWKSERGMEAYLREIVPGPCPTPESAGSRAGDTAPESCKGLPNR